MKVLIKYRVSIVFGLLGLLSLMVFSSIDARVDENGVLIEPFGFPPMFLLFELFAAVFFMLTVVRKN